MNNRLYPSQSVADLCRQLADAPICSDSGDVIGELQRASAEAGRIQATCVLKDWTAAQLLKSRIGPVGYGGLEARVTQKMTRYWRGTWYKPWTWRKYGYRIAGFQLLGVSLVKDPPDPACRITEMEDNRG